MDSSCFHHDCHIACLWTCQHSEEGVVSYKLFPGHLKTDPARVPLKEGRNGSIAIGSARGEWTDRRGEGMKRVGWTTPSKMSASASAKVSEEPIVRTQERGLDPLTTAGGCADIIVLFDPCVRINEDPRDGARPLVKGRTTEGVTAHSLARLGLFGPSLSSRSSPFCISLPGLHR